ncbi:MAG TPA: permease-like cell division protein FtsX [candidate division Zixibacteria bacterium]|nr:permease-like cell division protein FtsX [candidate division Zixibacteria bacterium]
MSAHFFKQELGRNVRRSPLSHLGSLIMAGLLFAFFDLLWIGSRVADSYFEELLAGVQMEIFFTDELSETEIDSRVAGLRELEGVERVEFVGKDAARQRLRQALGIDYLSGAESNPLPRSAQINFKRGFPTVESVAGLQTRFAAADGVLQVSYDEPWLRSTEGNRNTVANISRALLGAALIGAMLNAALLAGLIARAKTKQFGQLRMLGAGTGFLGSPLILEGGALAALAAGLSWMAVLLAQNNVQLPRVDTALPAEGEIALMIAAAGLVGVVGAYGAVKIALWRSR